MPTPYRSVYVYFASAAVLLGAFLLFAFVIGWPAAPDDCVTKTPNECYCEDFDPATIGKVAIQQKVNTWFNLYALFTSLLVAAVMVTDRQRKTSGGTIRSFSWKADVYVFAVLFLGLGSMWLHASLSKSVSWMDGLSMYVFAAYLLFYALDKHLKRHLAWIGPVAIDIVFWMGYSTTVVIFTMLGSTVGVPSYFLIIALVVPFLVFEFFWGNFIKAGKWYFISGAAAMGIATVFWFLSQTDMPLCDKDSFLQPHGLIWHPFAGIMAVMIYFYWRCEGPTAPARVAEVSTERWT